MMLMIIKKNRRYYGWERVAPYLDPRTITVGLCQGFSNTRLITCCPRTPVGRPNDTWPVNTNRPPRIFVKTTVARVSQERERATVKTILRHRVVSTFHPRPILYETICIIDVGTRVELYRFLLLLFTRFRVGS